MRVLVLGGTGTMGSELVKMLAADGSNRVVAVSRHPGDVEGVRYVIGNAFDVKFLRGLLEEHYDVIVDFMWYDDKTIAAVLPLFLDNCGQYFFMSSAAVCAPSNSPINEETTRYLDVLSNGGLGHYNDYHLLKARAEDVVRHAPGCNWTVVRPHVTFGPRNLPLVLWNIEVWLKRMEIGMPIALPVDVLNKKTTFTPAAHVARQISRLIGIKQALGEVVQVGSESVHEWGEVVEACIECLRSRGLDPKVRMVALEEFYRKCPNVAGRLKYDRNLNRVFDLKKYKRLTGDGNADAESMSVSIDKCIERSFSRIKGFIRPEVMHQHLANDVLCGCRIPFCNFSGRDKLLYSLRSAGVGERAAIACVYPGRALSQASGFFKRITRRSRVK